MKKSEELASKLNISDEDMAEFREAVIDEYENEPHGLYECFNCCSRYSVVWQSDFDFSDYGLDGEGVVHVLTCSNCGAKIEYYVRFDDPEEEESND